MLQLTGNNISDISSLSGLTKLTSLTLDDNRVSDLSALYGLSQLEVLSLRGNGLTADDILALQTALPRCVVLHDVTLTPDDLAKTRPSSNSDLR